MKRTKAENDPQREQDVSEQRGYGETPGRGNETAAAGYRAGQAPDTGDDHGILRDDGQPRPNGVAGEHIDAQSSPVISQDDDRSPNAPGTLNADKGSRKATPGAVTTSPGNTELEDAYSKNDPGVNTKR